MPYEKNKPLTQAENELWEKLVAQCKKVNEALDKGYVLVYAALRQAHYKAHRIYLDFSGFIIHCSIPL